MRRVPAGVVFLICLAGCRKAPPPADDVAGPAGPATAVEVLPDSPAPRWLAKLAATPRAGNETECIEKGGYWRRGGFANTWRCVFVARDRGKPCNDDYECEAFCKPERRVDEGTRTGGYCHNFLDSEGCNQGIDHGVAEHELCID